MARSARPVICPLCSATNTTRAAPGFRLRCPECFGHYRVPFAEDDNTPTGRFVTGDASTTSPKPEPSPSPAPEGPEPVPQSPPAAGPVVAHARPVPGAPAPDPSPELEADPETSHAELMLARQKAGGARGGRAKSMQGRVRRG
jgi:hypothetical protein